MSILSKAIGIDINAFKWATDQLLGSTYGPAVYEGAESMLEGKGVTTAGIDALTSFLESKGVPAATITAIVDAAGAYQSAIKAGDSVPVAAEEFGRSLLVSAVKGNTTEVTIIDTFMTALEQATKDAGL